MSKKPFISILVTEPIGGIEDVITEIPIDVRLATTHSFSAEVTEYPVEEGAIITDHVHLKPDTLSIEGFVSDSPVNVVPNVMPSLKGDSDTPDRYTRSQDAFDILQIVFRERTPLTVVDRFQTYEDMIIERLEIPQSPDRSTSLWFTMNLKKISTVETLTAALPPDVVARLKRRRLKVLRQKRLDALTKKYGEQKAKWIDQGYMSVATAESETDEHAKAVASQYFGGERAVVEREPL